MFTPNTDRQVLAVCVPKPADVALDTQRGWGRAALLGCLGSLDLATVEGGLATLPSPETCRPKRSSSSGLWAACLLLGPQFPHLFLETILTASGRKQDCECSHIWGLERQWQQFCAHCGKAKHGYSLRTQVLPWSLVGLSPC